MIILKNSAVEFDPSIPAHRQAVRDFQERQAWADSELRFKHDEEYGSIAAQVRVKLLAWYIKQDSELK